MSPEQGMLWIAGIGAAVTLGTVVFLAGVLKGAISAELRNIMRRLENIEDSLERRGLMRKGPRHVHDSR